MRVWHPLNHPLKHNRMVFTGVYIEKMIDSLEVCSNLIIILRLRYSFPVRISGIVGELDVVHHADDVRW